MDTTEFLRLIWPDGSNFFATKLIGRRMRHYPLANIDQASKLIAHLDKTAGNVYYAMASYREVKYTDSKGDERCRTQENVGKLKCFWIDLDCKGRNDGTDYPNQVLAVKDMLRFCAETKLPRPTITVNSGYGIHAYWVLDEAISEREWMAAAKHFSDTLTSHGVIHDTGCTADSARILRPLGTHNRKDGAGPREVKLIGSVRTTLPLATFLSCLVSGPVPASGFATSSFGDVDMSLNVLGANASEFPPSSIKEIIKGCALVKALARLGGDVPEPLWRGTLGLVKHTIEGAEAIHFFSKKYAGYTAQETTEKTAQWATGPATCDLLHRECSPDLKTHCAACPHRGSITSPITLGYAKVLMVETTHVMEAGRLVEVPVEVPAVPASLSLSYKFENDKLWVSTLDKDASKAAGKDEYVWVPFCDFYFYPFSYYDDEVQRHRMVWRLREREGLYKEFVLSGGAMGAGGPALFKELGDQGVVSRPGGKPHMEAYITRFMTEVKKRAPSTTTYTHFGWNGDDFLLGETLITPSGEHKKARLGGGAASLAKHFIPKGSVEKWVDLIDRAYNYPGQEQYQFVLCTGFGSPLLHLMGQRGGAVVSAVSEKSGHGKSTAGMLATGIYGSSKGGDLTLTREQATDKAIFAMAGVLHSIPVMVDEMTNIKPLVASNIIYTFSQGSGRIGLYNDGSLNLGRHDWAAVMNISANKPMTDLILSAKPGAEAELARMIEFECEDVSKLDKEAADSIFRELFNCHTAVGLKYMTWVQQNIEEVRTTLEKTQVLLDKRLGLERKDRFWSYAIVADIVGAMIARKIGLIQFDVGSIVKWLGTRVIYMREEVKALKSSPAQLFSSMLTDISPGLIVTDIEGDKRQKHPAMPRITREPRAPYTGRVVLDERRAYVIQPVVHKWCVENQVGMKNMIQEMVALGWVLYKGDARLKFPAKGTDITMGQFRCYTIDLDKLEAASEKASHLSTIVSIFDKERVA